MRHLRHTKFVLFLLIAGIPQSAALADQVLLKNGDRITGTIIKKEGNNLTIKSDQLGMIITPWDQVASISADKPLNLVLLNGKTVNGMFSLKEQKVQLTGYESPVSLMQDDVMVIRNDDEQKAYDALMHSGWGKLWEGIGTIGLAGTAGNSKTMTYTAGLNAHRTTHNDKTSVHFSAIKSTALVNGVNEDTAEAVRGGLGYSHDIGSRLFLNGFNDYEYDRFQNLDLRFVAGGGVGFHALRTERSRMELFGGMAFNRSSFSTETSQRSGEFYWGNEYTFKLNSSTNFTQGFRMFNKFTESGYRVNFDLGIATKLMKWLTWNVSASDRFFSDPVPGRKTNDFLYTTGIGISFSR